MTTITGNMAPGRAASGATGLAARMIPFGIAFWAVGVGCIRLLIPAGLFAPGMMLLLLALTAPVAWASTRPVQRLAPGARLVDAVAMASMPALMLDGLVLTFAPSLYSADPATRVLVGAFLLWFVGCAIGAAFLRAR